MRGFLRASLSVALLTAACLATPVSGVAADASTGWHVQPSPNITAPSGQVTAVSCASSSTCVAVGTYLDSGGVLMPMAERWNGTSWQRETIPTPAGGHNLFLSAVSCVGTGFCVIVGSADASTTSADWFGVAYTWNRTSWSIQSLPRPAGAESEEIRAVSCVSRTFCEAVGGAVTSSTGSIVSLAERWNGSTWSIQISPNQGFATELDGVSCASRHACQAVDAYGGMAEQWNGTTWTVHSVQILPGIDDPSLTAVSCPTTNLCEAVGTYITPGPASTTGIFAEGWNGTAWTEQPVPTMSTGGAEFSGVSCVSATSCVAVGSQEANVSGSAISHALVDQWNGTSWVSEQALNSGGKTPTTLIGVACVGTTCEAGGSFPMGMELWNGTSWARQASVLPPGAIDNTLTGVSCVSATDCEAVGYTSSSPTRLEEVWNGASWQIQSRVQSLPKFAAVSCPTATFCEAVGTTAAATAAGEWNGTAWVPQSTPGTSATFSSVSCPSMTFCVAVGPSGAMTWDGTSWSAATLPNSGYSNVSCASPAFCEAVGPGRSSSAAFAAGWNGSTWTAQSVPAPTGATRVQLVAASCPTASACEAVGESTSGAYSMAWNGKAWALQGILPVPTGVSADVVSGLSCTSATDCTMVGHTAGDGQTLAELWNGTSWTIQTTANLTTANNGLNAVFCTAGGPCRAVGSYPDAGGGYSSTLVETTG